MKKPKVKLDSASIQAFLLNHIEKIIFGAVLLLMALLVYQGMGLQGLDGSKQPDQLMQISRTAMETINRDRTEEVVGERRSQYVSKFSVEVEEQLAPTDAGHYFLANSLSKPDFPKLAPRKDPVLLAPTHLIAVPIIGPLAVLAKPGEIDPLYELPPEDEEETAKTQPKKTKAKKGRPGGYPGYPGGPGGYPGGPGGYPGGEMMDENYDPYGGGAGRRGRATRSKRGSRSSTSGGSMESGMAYDPSMEASSYSDSAGSGGMPGGMPGMYGSNRGDLYPEAMEYGYNPTHPMAVAKSVQAVVITAVVPYEKQWEEHEKALGESLDYDPQRDIPHYEYLRIERADVTDIPDETDPAVLEPRFAAGRLNVRQAMRESVGEPASRDFPRGIPPTWAGWPPELIDPLYQDPKLTYPAPPFMQRDLWDVLTHPEVPLASARMRPAETPTAETPTRPEAAPADDLPGRAVVPGAAAGGGYGGMPGSGGYGGMPGGGYGGMPGGGYGGMPGGGYGMPGSDMASDSYGGGYGMPGGGGYGSPYGGSMGGYGAGASFSLPKYKMIRFTDTTVEQGKKYRYRLRVLLHDPNHPNVADPTRPPTPGTRMFAAPNPASLHDDVRKRLRDVKSGEWWVASPWSEPTPIVELPPTRRFYAGTVNPSGVGRIRVGDRDVAIPTGQPDANALAVVWDTTKVVDVPAESKVVRGSVFNFTQDVKVIHPVTKEVMDLEKYAFSTHGVVADIQGGEEIPRLDKERAPDKRITAPGELLVFDAEGRLHVQNEVEDIEMFRRFLPKPPDAQTIAGPGGPGYMPGGMPGDYDPYAAESGASYDPYGGGMPGDAGGGRRSRRQRSGP